MEVSHQLDRVSLPFHIIEQKNFRSVIRRRRTPPWELEGGGRFYGSTVRWLSPILSTTDSPIHPWILPTNPETAHTFWEFLPPSNEYEYDTCLCWHQND